MEKKKKKPAANPKSKVKAKPGTEIVPVQQREVNPQSLIALAVTQGASVETIGKFMDLQDRYEAKIAKRAFDAAMADFQSECPVIKKEKSGAIVSGKVAYKYAPIDAIVSQVSKLIAKHGLSYAIKTTVENNRLTAICIVKHKLGHSEESSFEVPGGEGTSLMSGPQKVAAALTFAKRYAFCNAFGIMTGDEDNDAQKRLSKDADLNAPSQFDIAMKMIAAESLSSKLKEYRKKIIDGKKFDAAQTKHLIAAIDEKLSDETGA